MWQFRQPYRQVRAAELPYRRLLAPLLLAAPVLGLLAFVLAFFLSGPLLEVQAAQALAVAEGTPNAPQTNAVAIAALEQAADQNPGSALIQRRLARAYTLAGQQRQAVTALERAYRIEPLSQQTLYELAHAYQAAGDLAGARQVLGSLGLGDIDLLARAVQAQSTGRYVDALRWFDLAANAGLVTPGSRSYAEAMLLDARGDDGGAFARLESAAIADTGWAAPVDRFLVWYRYAEALNTRRQTSEAIAAFDRAEQYYPADNPLPWLHSALYRQRGLAYASQSDAVTAIADLAKAVEANPRYAWAHMSYGLLRYEHEPDARQEALASVDTALAIEPANPDLWSTLVQTVANDRALLTHYCARLPAAIDAKEVREACGSI